MKVREWAMAAMALGLCLGCGTGKPSEEGTANRSAEGKRLTFAVIPKGMTHEFWKTIHAGAQDAADELGVKILWKGP